MSTRSRLLLLLRTRPGITVSELAAALGLTGMGVRRQLEALEADGLAERATAVRRGRGTPPRRLTPHPGRAGAAPPPLRRAGRRPPRGPGRAAGPGRGPASRVRRAMAGDPVRSYRTGLRKAEEEGLR